MMKYILLEKKMLEKQLKEIKNDITLAIILGDEKQLNFLYKLNEMLEENIKLCNDKLKNLGVE